MERTLGDSPTYATFSRLVRVQTALWQAVDVQLRERHSVTLAHVTALQVVGGIVVLAGVALAQASRRPGGGEDGAAALAADGPVIVAGADAPPHG